ncbi:MAG: PBP1A family penicillin-binding protein [Coriobacteriia bacterium]|nr:PBP1A family penicillin-binding protein [Coriobacteriia bacterium]
MRRRPKTTGATIALRVVAVVTVLVLVVGLIGAAAAFATVQKWLQNLPDYKAKNAFEVAQATRIYSADGKLLARLYLENREVVPITKISPYMVNAAVAVEDERFYKHHGVDPIGLVRAAVRTASGNRQGASTITQQYIRNTILLDERTDITYARKVREAYLAIELEKRYSKRDILEMYLNTIYLGEGAYGAQAASLEYFNRPASQLTLPQAALLAGLAQSPSRLDPYNNPEGAVTRRNEVLGRMLANNYITQAEHDAAVATKLKLDRNKKPNDGIYAAPYFVAHVKKLLQAQFSPAVVFKGGLTVYTTLDTRMQQYAEDAIKTKLSRVKGPEAALVSIDPRNGHVKALIGGRNYKKSKFNLATQGYRQPGSSFKTFVLLAALNKGMPPYFQIDSSSPAAIPTKPKPWIVDNSEGAGHGMMSLQSATTASVNTVFARVAWEIGIKDVASMARRMGIKTKIPNYPSIALGARNVTPYEMAAAYGTLATEGVRRDPVCITKVVDRDDRTIYVASKHGKRVLKASVAKAGIDVLRGVISGGTATRARIGRPAAGKTGTSQLNRDVWFVGFTPQLVTSVWVGYPKERTIYVGGSRAFGGTVCAPIWAAYMRKALAGQPVLGFPSQPRPAYNASKFHIPVSRPPSVKGLTLAAAGKKLDGYGYTVRYEYSNRPKGTVIGQSSKNGKIVLIVSKGPKPVAPKPPPSEEPTGSGEGTGTP